MNPDCRYCEELMLDYRWLDDHEHRILEKHLRKCPRCRENARLMEDIGAVFRELNADPVPAEFADRVMAAIRQPEPETAAFPVIPALVTVLLLQFLFIAGTAGSWLPFRTGASRVAQKFYQEWIVGGVTMMPLTLRALTQGISNLVGAPLSLDWTLVGGSVTIVFALTLAAIHSADRERDTIPGRLPLHRGR